jgi:hypothetical protein
MDAKNHVDRKEHVDLLFVVGHVTDGDKIN